MNLKHFLLWVSLTGCFYSSNVYSTSFYIRPMSEFTQTSPNIVYGTITQVRVEKGITQTGRTTIYTYATLEWNEVLKGTINKNPIQIRKAGGTLNGLTLDIPSSPEFHENEKTVLFLSEPNLDQSYDVMGMELGKFSVVQQQGKTFLQGGLLSYDASESASTSEKKAWSLQDLRELIQKQSLHSQPQKDTQNDKSLAQPAQTTPSLATTTANPTSSSVPTQVAEISSTPTTETKTGNKIPLFSGVNFTILGLVTLVLSFIFYIKNRKK